LRQYSVDDAQCDLNERLLLRSSEMVLNVWF
jgi:hypothetical protein